MQNDERDLLEVLKFELKFLEQGGYGCSPRTPWRPQYIFEDSLTCMNYESKENLGPCSDCVLMHLVPPERCSEKIPCRHIPFNASGETLDSLYRYSDQNEIEETVGNWLRATIQCLEEERTAVQRNHNKQPTSSGEALRGTPLYQKQHPKCANPLTADGAFDYVEREHFAQLPMAVRPVLNEKKLRAELEEARKALRHSQSLYRALVENPAYGICRCDAEGKFLDVNQALLAMLGYSTKVELLAANRASEIVLDLAQGKPLAGSSPESVRIEPVEIEWKRKNGTTLKARLSGRGVFDERGDFVSYEIIAVDVTEQRTLEDHLRRQALSDSLTGLANHRQLFEALHSEICRSKRTEREFSLLLLDLDGLKEINDRFGHLVGNRALCRLAQILADCCRSVDTAARQGGDEFALVLPETGVAAATLVAKRICDLLAKDAEEPALSVSVGVASYPKDAETIGALIYAADLALYTMKDKQPRAAWAGQVS